MAFLPAYPAACRWFEFFQKPLAEKALLLITLWAIFSGFLWWLDRWLKILKTIGQAKWKGWAAAGLATLIGLILFHWLPPAFPSYYQVEIRAEGKARLVQVFSGGHILPLDQFVGSGGWNLIDAGWEQSGAANESLTYSGSTNAPMELDFSTGSESGTAAITLQGKTTAVNLNTPLPDFVFIQPFPVSLGSPSWLWIFWVGLLALAEWLLFTILLYFLFSRWAAGTTAVLFPILFLYPYVTTIAGHNVTLGNDFGPFYYVYKTYLLDFLSNGHFPLWSPSEGAGYPFFSNPLAQAAYPPNLLMALIYRINEGYTRLDHQIYTAAAICWFSLGLYAWLRSLNVEKRYALFAALTMALSYKMTELLRFPNAAHEAAWYPWILLALTKLFSAANWKTTGKWATGLFISLVCLFTAGYPYYVYYLPFMAAPYLIFMLVPRVRSILFRIEKPEWRRFLIGFCTAALFAVLVCGPYLYQMAQTIAQTSGRSGDDFQHATMYPFDFQDTVESLVYPPAARPEGWFYFGTLGLTLMVLYLAHLHRNDNPGEDVVIQNRRSWPVKVALLGWLIFLSYLSYGEQSYLFLLFYKILPEFSALRGWGRLSITLLPGLALLMAFALGDFESRFTSPARTFRKLQSDTWIPLCVLALSSLGFQIFEFTRGITDEYWELYFIPRTGYLMQTVANVFGRNVIPDPKTLSAWFSYSYIAFSLLSIAFVLVLLMKRDCFTTQHKNWMLAGLGLFSALNLWCGGAWLWNNGFSPREERKLGNFQRMMSPALSTPRKNEDSTLTLSPSFSVGSPPKWHYGRYQDFYNQFAGESSARDELLGVTDGKRFFFSESISQTSIASFLLDSHRYKIKPVIHEYTGDSLLVEVTVPVSGYFTFIDNWDENWKARVDGKPVEIKRLFYTFKSVSLDAGRHEIAMAYCPMFFTWANDACMK